ncbi:MAG: glycogen debranching N-terminal domain-containing protein [Chloroflexota bacterium]
MTIIPATDLGNVEVAKAGNLYLLTDARGDIRPDGRGLGLYLLDTRILSSSILRVNGSGLTLLRGPHREGEIDTIQLTNPELRRNPANKHGEVVALALRELSVTRARRIDGTLHERVIIESFSETVEPLEIQLGLGVDMADIFEVRGYRRPTRGTLRPIEIDGERVAFGYDGVDGRRVTTTVTMPRAKIRATPDPDAWPGTSIVATWTARLRPRGRFVVEWTIANEVTESPDARPTRTVPALLGDTPPAHAPRFEVPHIRSDHEFLDRTLTRSVADLHSLHNDGPGPGEQYLAAGIPWFTTLFGRDSIIAALETVAFVPSLAASTLEVLARLQATTDDPWRDAEPGKILHELRTGEMARAGETPHSPYYGSVDSTPLWLILLGEVHAWTGDDALVDKLWPHALAALEWIDRSGDLDGDGFVEYERRSRLGLRNQGWKDSGDAIRHTDGSTCDGPIALAEVQGYVYAARRAMARLARHRGDDPLATRLDAEADQLRDRFDAAFWLDDVGFYAMALDGAKRPAATIGSNAGQALWSGIVPPARAKIVAERMLQPDLFSGWGIRTYAAGQTGYNPVGYHTGSVWPHDNALAAAGFKSAGAADGANMIAGRLIEAAQWFPDLRLPELFCGYDRTAVGAPVAYPVACSPQAWAAAAPFSLISTMLGLRPNATERRLELVQPTLPDWLTKLTITGLPIGGESVDLLVHRWRGRTSAEVLGRRGSIDVIIHA